MLVMVVSVAAAGAPCESGCTDHEVLFGANHECEGGREPGAERARCSAVTPIVAFVSPTDSPEFAGNTAAGAFVVPPRREATKLLESEVEESGPYVGLGLRCRDEGSTKANDEER